MTVRQVPPALTLPQSFDWSAVTVRQVPLTFTYLAIYHTYLSQISPFLPDVLGGVEVEINMSRSLLPAVSEIT